MERRRPPSVQSLLGSGRPRDQHPEGEEWRADSLARSQHSRLDAEISSPAEDYGEERAAALCAEIARGLLGDFAPALLLLPAAERRRAQALLAYAATLFDFARQRGVGLVACSANALNQYIERHTDALMRRTETRPLPSGRMTPAEVLILGLVLAACGLAFGVLSRKRRSLPR